MQRPCALSAILGAPQRQQSVNRRTLPLIVVEAVPAYGLAPPLCTSLNILDGQVVGRLGVYLTYAVMGATWRPTQPASATHP